MYQKWAEENPNTIIKHNYHNRVWKGIIGGRLLGLPDRLNVQAYS